MTPELLTTAVAVEGIVDGGCYRLPPNLLFEQTNLFFRIARAGGLYIKLPTDRGIDDYRILIRDAGVTESDIRPLEDEERRDPAVDREDAHYLTVHRRQYERLRAADSIGIPEARFARIQGEASGFSPGHSTPAIFQQRIPGATLWDMFDFDSLCLRPAWQPFKKIMASQLRAVIESALIDHVDWNIRNFVFHGAEQRLYYVDSKPAVYVARSSNEKNLSGIRAHFLT